MALEINRRAVAITVYAKCRKKYGAGTVASRSCTQGASVAFGKTNVTNPKIDPRAACHAVHEYGDPNNEDACLDGVKMFEKGIKHIGPRLAGKRKRSKR